MYRLKELRWTNEAQLPPKSYKIQRQYQHPVCETKSLFTYEKVIDDTLTKPLSIEEELQALYPIPVQQIEISNNNAASSALDTNNINKTTNETEKEVKKHVAVN